MLMILFHKYFFNLHPVICPQSEQIFNLFLFVYSTHSLQLAFTTVKLHSSELMFTRFIQLRLHTLLPPLFQTTRKRLQCYAKRFPRKKSQSHNFSINSWRFSEIFRHGKRLKFALTLGCHCTEIKGLSRFCCYTERTKFTTQILMSNELKQKPSRDRGGGVGIKEPSQIVQTEKS